MKISSSLLLIPGGKLLSRLIAVSLLALVLGGCASPVSQTVPFAETDYPPADATGTAVIYGHAFVRSDTGIKRGAAGIKVYLVPLTAYTEERAKIMESGNDPVPADSRLDKYVRTTVGDIGGGGFQFENLPAGEYLVYCKIEWERQFAGSMRRDGSGSPYALARAKVANGEHKKVVVTNLGQK